MKKKLYIENVPPKLSADELNEWLEPYGTVARMELTDDSRQGGGRAGFV